MKIRKCRNKQEKEYILSLVKELIGAGDVEDAERAKVNNIIVAVDNEQIIGGGIFYYPGEYPETDLWAVKPYVHKKYRCLTGLINFVVVDKTLQTKGVGTLLVKAMMDKLIAHGCTKIFAYVWAGSPGNASYKTFSKCGFVLKKVIENAWDELDNYNCSVCYPDRCSCSCDIMLWCKKRIRLSEIS